MIVEFCPELCCDDCLSVIYVHFEECPNCKGKYTDTDQYSDFMEWGMKIGDEVYCEDCNKGVKLIKKDGYWAEEWEWEYIRNES